MRQPWSSRRLVLTLERATARITAISSAGSGRGETKSRAWICATVRLMPQRVPISPQWRTNFWAVGESGGLCVCSVISVWTESTVVTAGCQAQSRIGAHPQEAEEMGRRGQASVLRRFNWDSEAEKLVQLYRALTVELQEHASTSPVPSTLRSSKLFFRRLSLKMAV